MGANTLTGLIPTIETAAENIGHELVGLIPAVLKDSSGEQAGLNQVIRYPIADDGGELEDVTSGATGPDPDGTTDTYADMAITNSKSTTFFVTAEEQKNLTAKMLAELMRQRFEVRMRRLTNAIEADLAALYIYASRAHGTAGTVPFGTAGDFSDLSQALKLLKDMGMSADPQLVLNTTAGASFLGKQSSASVQGTDAFVRQGVLLDMFGCKLRESGQIKRHTAGTNDGAYDVNGVTPAVGDTTIPFDTGSGTILVGDVIVNAETGRDPVKYVVGTALTGGSLAIREPGLATAWVDGDTITGAASYTANMIFPRAAIHLLTRVPPMPDGGDAADDVTVVTDAWSGLSYQIAMYRQKRRVAYEVAASWGVKAVGKFGLLVG